MTKEKGMSAEAKAARNAYLREWRKKNPNKVRQHQENYWQRQAERQEAEDREGVKS